MLSAAKCMENVPQVLFEQHLDYHCQERLLTQGDNLGPTTINIVWVNTYIHTYIHTQCIHSIPHLRHLVP